MAAENVEGQLGAEDLSGLPAPKIGSEASEQPAPSAAPAVDVTKLADEVAERLRPQFVEIAGRTAQGKVDKFAYQFGTMKKYLDEAKGDPNLAARNMAIDEIVAERQPAPQRDQGRPQGGDVVRSAERILKRAAQQTGVRVKSDDARLTALFQQEWMTEDAFLDAVEDLAFSQKVSAAAVAGGAGGGAPSPTDLDAKIEALNAKLAAAMKNPSTPLADIAAIQKELREALAQA